MLHARLDPTALYHHLRSFFFFFNDTATTEIYTLSLHDALPISPWRGRAAAPLRGAPSPARAPRALQPRWLPAQDRRGRQGTLRKVPPAVGGVGQRALQPLARPPVPGAALPPDTPAHDPPHPPPA